MKKKKIAILISGNGSNMKSLICDMDEPEHLGEPAIVIADRPDAKGLEFAKSKKIKTAIVSFNDFPNKLYFERQLIKLIKNSKSEIICLAGFMRILSPEFVSMFKNCVLNIHPSLLPYFKGLNTHVKALNSGMSLHGATVHLVTSDLDAGKILGQGFVPIFKNDTNVSLAERVLKLEHKLYPIVLKKFLKGNVDKILLTEL